MTSRCVITCHFMFYLFYLLEKFVWNHTSLNFVHTIKSPQTAGRTRCRSPVCRGTPAFLANASPVLQFLLGIETYCTSKRGICALAHRGDLNPQPQLCQHWQGTAPPFPHLPERGSETGSVPFHAKSQAPQTFCACNLCACLEVEENSIGHTGTPYLQVRVAQQLRAEAWACSGASPFLSPGAPGKKEETAASSYSSSSSSSSSSPPQLELVTQLVGAQSSWHQNLPPTCCTWGWWWPSPCCASAGECSQTPLSPSPPSMRGSKDPQRPDCDQKLAPAIFLVRPSPEKIQDFCHFNLCCCIKVNIVIL